MFKNLRCEKPYILINIVIRKQRPLGLKKVFKSVPKQRNTKCISNNVASHDPLTAKMQCKS